MGHPNDFKLFICGSGIQVLVSYVIIIVILVFKSILGVCSLLFFWICCFKVVQPNERISFFNQFLQRIVSNFTIINPTQTLANPRPHNWSPMSKFVEIEGSKQRIRLMRLLRRGAGKK